jgi:DNA polymerase alpha subunit A
MSFLPDFDWYIRQQVYPPVCRLCVPIEGTDAVKIANCLGMKIRAGPFSDLK